jgi:hypothetical protein
MGPIAGTAWVKRDKVRDARHICLSCGISYFSRACSAMACGGRATMAGQMWFRGKSLDGFHYFAAAVCRR